ncbi:hypothetical protein E2C01_058019 [Portunus trituberculatus]|uniref:Uncharacterized protein n=1 Tax=Portunus trituberculatus TaxID=210409 RepID=A0A5B7GUH7_PORTR|nr:hypothetical protein [Portunus trituberculatus]
MEAEKSVPLKGVDIQKEVTNHGGDVQASHGKHSNPWTGTKTRFRGDNQPLRLDLVFMKDLEDIDNVT